MLKKLFAGWSKRSQRRGFDASSAERRAKNRSFDLAQDRLSGGVLMRYVGATPLGAEMIPAAIERNYPKRLLKAGWWHMSLFQQPARTYP